MHPEIARRRHRIDSQKINQTHEATIELMNQLIRYCHFMEQKGIKGFKELGHCMVKHVSILQKLDPYSDEASVLRDVLKTNMDKLKKALNSKQNYLQDNYKIASSSNN